MLKDEVDRESHLFLSSGPRLAKAREQDLGTKVGGRSLSWSADRNFFKKILALTSLLLKNLDVEVLPFSFSGSLAKIMRRGL